MARHGFAVVCKQVRKRLGSGDQDIEILRGIDLEVAAGEITFIVGPSGCGKTTLLSVITGLLHVSSGEVCLLNRPQQSLSPAERVLFRRENVGFVFQQFNLLPALTAAENVAVPLLAAGVPRETAVARGRELLEQLGLAARADALPAQMSGGQQQRVALARALVHEPKLLVCDEPTSALDASNGKQVMELLASFALQPQRAVIVVTHDSRVYSFANTIAYMDDGRIDRIETDRLASRTREGRDPVSVEHNDAPIFSAGSLC